MLEFARVFAAEIADICEAQELKEDMKRVALTLTALIWMSGCSSEPTAETAADAPHAPDTTFYSGMNIIVGDGTETIPEGTMIVENGKITALGKKDELRPPKGAARVDFEGRTIAPVLVDLHSHLGMLKGMDFSAKNYSAESIQGDLDRFLYYGVGAVMALGSDSPDIATKIRDESRTEASAGARFYTAGRGITAKGGWPTHMAALKEVPYQVADEAEARKAVQELAAAKVDMVKIWVDDGGGKMPKLSQKVYAAVIDEAHKNNLRVMAHLFSLADAKELVKAGLDGIAHSIRDREVDSDLIQAMKEKNVFFVATLTGHQSGFVYADKPEWIGEQFMREAYGAVLHDLAAESFMTNYKKAIDPNGKKQFQMAMRNFKKLSDAGVRIGFGTDSGTALRWPGYFQHRELELMVEAGMTPIQAITAATKTSSEILGINDLGTLATGKTASFLVFTANPAEKITNTKELFTVFVRGKEVDRSAMMQRFSAAP